MGSATAVASGQK